VILRDGPGLRLLAEEFVSLGFELTDPGQQPLSVVEPFLNGGPRFFLIHPGNVLIQTGDASRRRHSDGRTGFIQHIQSTVIFLNLILSMLAAIQAPIIMMAQNRQTQHDRVDAAHDYEVNLKAEIEIMALHEKLDQLRNDQLVAILKRIEALAEDIRKLEGGARLP